MMRGVGGGVAGASRDTLCSLYARSWRPDLSEGEARAILEDCMRVLWYRDTRALNRITLAKVSDPPA